MKPATLAHVRALIDGIRHDENSLKLRKQDLDQILVQDAKCPKCEVFDKGIRGYIIEKSMLLGSHDWAFEIEYHCYNCNHIWKENVGT